MMNNNNLLILIAVLLIGILGVMVANAPERHRTAGDEISDGLNQIGNGIEDAAHDIAPHRDEDRR